MIPFTQDIFLKRGKVSIQPLYRLHIRSYVGGSCLKEAYVIPKYWDGIAVGPVCHDEDGYKDIAGTVRLKLIQRYCYIDYPF